ncbi:MAG: SU10 major capsid protein, partial [Phycisphaerales bacterium]
VVTHVDNIGGVLTKPLLTSWAEAVFSSGSRTKTLFAGPTLLTAIHGLYEGDVRHTTPQTNVGLRIAQVVTPHGNLNLVPHNGFTGAYAGDGIAVDIDKLYMRHTDGGELQLKADTQAQGDDATRDEMFAEFGLEYGPEEDHAQIRGVTG